MHHVVKTPPAHFEAILSGDKTFDVQDNRDRGFQKGDTVEFQEYDHTRFTPYTPRVAVREITYVTNCNQKDGYVVFAVKKQKDFCDGCPKLDG